MSSPIFLNMLSDKHDKILKNRTTFLRVTSKRFDCDEECRQLCLDIICVFFGIPYEKIEILRKINDFSATYEFFARKKLNVSGYISRLLLFNPKFWFYKHFYSISHDVRFFDTHNDCIFLYFTSAKELYGINENWTHCICEIFYQECRIIYDSYYNKVTESYPWVLFPSHECLMKKKVLVIKLQEGKQNENSLFRI